MKRSINLGFRVTEEEQKLIYQRKDDAGIRNLRAYLLKMALNGLIVRLDLADVRECSRLLRTVSNNVNQIAKRVNEGGSIYAEEIADIKTRLDEIWRQQDKTIQALAKVPGVF